MKYRSRTALAGWMGSSVLVAVMVCLGHVVSGEGDPWTEDESLRKAALEQLGQLQPVSPEEASRPSVELGRRLFWDKRLSASGQLACASCHLAENWGADARRYSIDARGRPTGRHSQTVFNAALQPKFRWLADRDSAAQQASGSLTGSMGFDSADQVVPLLREYGYEPKFVAAFPDDLQPVNPENYGRAIAAYEETLITPAPFDRFLGGDDDALESPQKEGLRLFLEIGCTDCHSGPLLGGQHLEKFGVYREYWTANKYPPFEADEKPDRGRYAATGDEADQDYFRVPMLRNIARTGPYFHDGSVDGLADAVQIMAEVQLGEELDDESLQQVLAFLNSLTGDRPENYQSPFD